MRKLFDKHVNTKLFLINIVTALFLNLFLEYMERKSIDSVLQFIDHRTFLFVYNVLLIFMILSPVFLVKKKYFAYAVLGGLCFAVGLVNGIVLNNRKTPFTAVDLTIAKSTLPILKNYFAMWQIVLGVIGVIVLVFILVSLYLFSPEYRKEFSRKRGIAIVGFFFLVLLVFTWYGKKSELLHKKFDNLIIGYQEYGVAYCFIVTMCDTGIDRPIDYSKEYIDHLMRNVDRKIEKKTITAESDRKPNIIFIQLESFFDITNVKGLEFSRDPLPVLHQMQKEYISGQLSVPVYGAGTINTEFEAITGMNLDDFGTGEYPYRSILHKTTCDSMAYWMKDEGYVSSVLHNNNASFYDRDAVFSNLGFDYFISSENMYIKRFTDMDWAKDSVLEGEILNVLEKTPQKDYIYTISVQGHGDYPSEELDDPDIMVYAEGDEPEHQNQVIYYTNQIAEMDDFIGHLTSTFEDYPEDVLLVFYGDHLPALGYETADLKKGNKFQTPYIIWDNYGYSQKRKEEDSGNVQSFELASKILAMTNIRTGVLNRYQQTMGKSRHYKKNQKMLEYDLLYGSRCSLAPAGARKPTELQYSLRDIQIHSIKSYGGGYLLLGEGFTASSRVYVDGLLVKSHVNNGNVIHIPEVKLSDEDEIVIHQVSKTNENTTLNCGEPFVFDSSQVKPLYKTKE